MLNWLTEKFTRADDSLASETGLRAFLEPILALKPALALHDIADRFANPAELGLDAAACRRVLQRLDEAVQPHLEETWAGLFADSLGKSVSNSAWNALVNYHSNVFSGYWHCLERLPPSDKLDDKARQDAIILVTRAMSALVSHKALMRIRYRDPYAVFSTDAHDLLARALQYDIAQISVKLYPGNTQQTTAEREYITGLLLDVAPTGNLLPSQTRCLHLILQHFNEHYRLADKHGPYVPFFIDAAKGTPPQRWLVGLTSRPGMSFFGFGAAYKYLGALRKAAGTENAPPEWLRQSGIDAERYRVLLDILMEQWSQNPPQRRSHRDHQVASILVTHGLAQVCRMLSYSKFAKEGKRIKYTENSSRDPKLFKEFRFGTVDENKPLPTAETPLAPMEMLHQFELAGDRELTERWSVVDTSDGGLGAVAEQHRGWLCAGMLIGFRYYDNIDWQIATVRRVGRTSKGKVAVGLKCHMEKAVRARLRLQEGLANESWIAAGTSADPFTDAIVVDGEQPMLFVEPGVYAPERECVMKIAKSTQHIRFETLLESGADFECISFSRCAPDGIALSSSA